MPSRADTMNIDDFKRILRELKDPPEQLSEVLKALWYDAKGDWDRAHRIAQEVGSRDGSWVHAYLHRKEGDLDNARYWYGRAGRSECQLPLQGEWEQIALHLCAPAE